MDGATPIVVIDTDHILESLHHATQKNREADTKQGSSDSSLRNHSNGSI